MKTVLDGLQKIVLTLMVVLAVAIVFIALQIPAPKGTTAAVLAVEPALFLSQSLASVAQAPASHAAESGADGTQPDAEVRLPLPPTPTPPLSPRPGGPRPVHVGIISGHYKNDSGAVCPDGLREVDINLAVSERVVARLRRKGYEIDFLSEFDPALEQYTADALLSIHSDSCEVWGMSGFKVARATASGIPDIEDRLVRCLKDSYAASTGLGFHADTISTDMTAYHAFHEIAVDTPSAIIELGFMADDRDTLVYRQDRIAKGIVDGLQCFLTSQEANH